MSKPFLKERQIKAEELLAEAYAELNNEIASNPAIALSRFRAAALLFPESDERRQEAVDGYFTLLNNYAGDIREALRLAEKTYYPLYCAEISYPENDKNFPLHFFSEFLLRLDLRELNISLSSDLHTKFADLCQGVLLELGPGHEKADSITDLTCKGLDQIENVKKRAEVYANQIFDCPEGYPYNLQKLIIGFGRAVGEEKDVAVRFALLQDQWPASFDDHAEKEMARYIIQAMRKTTDLLEEEMTLAIAKRPAVSVKGKVKEHTPD